MSASLLAHRRLHPESTTGSGTSKVHLLHEQQRPTCSIAPAPTSSLSAFSRAPSLFFRSSTTFASCSHSLHTLLLHSTYTSPTASNSALTTPITASLSQFSVSLCVFLAATHGEEVSARKCRQCATTGARSISTCSTGDDSTGQQRGNVRAGFRRGDSDTAQTPGQGKSALGVQCSSAAVQQRRSG